MHSILKNLNFECVEVVEDLCDTLILDFLNIFVNKELETLSEWREEIFNQYIDESCMHELEMHDRVRLITDYGHDYDIDKINCDSNNLGIKINEVGTYIFRQMSENLAYEILKELEEFMEEYELDVSNIAEGNNYSNFVHVSETDIDENKGSIYHYKNLEQEQIHVDVYKYRLMKDRICYFEKYIEGETEENN